MKWNWRFITTSKVACRRAGREAGWEGRREEEKEVGGRGTKHTELNHGNQTHNKVSTGSLSLTLGLTG